MELMRAVDAYCERMGAGFWDEPVNAVTNLAFILAAVVMWRRTAGIGLARLLCAVLAAIGVGSFLFHTYAQVWAAIADVTPIGVFILLYLFAINRDVLRLRPVRAALMTALFVPFAAVTMPIFAQIPELGASAGYAPVPLLIFIYAACLWRAQPGVAAGLFWGGVLLCVSLAFRTVDEPLCAAVPLGTHFMWHVLNGLMLGWMIEVYRRSRLGNVHSAR